ncbi:MAG: trigger factor [Sporolactobacillus sp.]|jgi:trigger factor|nr:trigger factor [Sporolactobacillus sp.]MCI1881163.1 trigger factor [Sporolactobacillus sp.]
MTVEAKWEKKEENAGTLTFEVDADSFSRALDKAFRKVVRKVTVPGFRKGRVPRVLFEQRFGVESLYEDALDFILPDAYPEAIEKTGIDPVDKPKLSVKEIGKGKKLVLEADVTVKPEVKLGQYKGLEVEEKNTEVTDADVDHEIKHLQERYAELVVKDNGTVEKGDTVVIDFDGYIDGKPFEGGKAENYSLEIGSNSFIPGFEDQLIGMNADSEKEIKVTFPDDYHAEELKGKEAAFKVKVKEIKRKQLPELDDEFAKDVDDEVDTLAKLKKKIKDRLQKERVQNAEDSKRADAVEQATANAQINLPEIMIANELDNMMEELERRLKAQGITLDVYSQITGKDKQALREQMKDDAEKRVRQSLTLEAIAKAEHIEPSEDEINTELKKIADIYKISVDQLKDRLPSTDPVKHDLTLNKAADFLVESSKPKAAEPETKEEKPADDHGEKANEEN